MNWAAALGVALLAVSLAFVMLGARRTQPAPRPCVCGLIDLGGAHFYLENGRIHEEHRCGPVLEWIP